MDNNFNENNNTINSNSSYSYNNTNQQNGTANGWSAQAASQTQQTNGNGYNPYMNNTAYNNPNAAYNAYEAPKKKKKERVKRERGKSGFGIKLAKCVAIALVFGLVAGTAFEGTSYFWGGVLGTNETHTEVTLNKTDNTSVQTTSTSTSDNGNLTIMDVSGIVKDVMPSIVSITNMSEVQYQNWFGQTQTQQSESCGSGIIVSQDDTYIYIATNNHVVTGAETITVQFSDDTTVSAEVKGTDSGSDLAVVAVKISDLSSDTLSTIKVATLGSSDSLQVGESAIAIGNALGYGQSVTTGVISALNREVTISDETTGATTTNELIQTDAAINPGNSGGALLNIKGEVIGINSVKYSSTTVEGMGYAIPIDTASPIIEKLINREPVDSTKSAYLGISGVDVSSSVAQTYNMPEGVYLYDVDAGSAAANAGLTAGDIITSFNGSKINSTAGLESEMAYCAAGDEVEVVFQRQNNGTYEEQTVTVTLGSKN